MDQNFLFESGLAQRKSPQGTAAPFSGTLNQLGWIDQKPCKTLDARSSSQVTVIFNTLELAQSLERFVQATNFNRLDA
jgi:hypothetical protein